jgi:hypothetical protein
MTAATSDRGLPCFHHGCRQIGATPRRTGECRSGEARTFPPGWRVRLLGRHPASLGAPDEEPRPKEEQYVLTNFRCDPLVFPAGGTQGGQAAARIDYTPVAIRIDSDQGISYGEAAPGRGGSARPSGHCEDVRSLKSMLFKDGKAAESYVGVLAIEAKSTNCIGVGRPRNGRVALIEE